MRSAKETGYFPIRIPEAANGTASSNERISLEWFVATCSTLLYSIALIMCCKDGFSRVDYTLFSFTAECFTANAVLNFSCNSESSHSRHYLSESGASNFTVANSTLIMSVSLLIFYVAIECIRDCVHLIWYLSRSSDVIFARIAQSRGVRCGPSWPRTYVVLPKGLLKNQTMT